MTVTLNGLVFDRAARSIRWRLITNSSERNTAHVAEIGP